MTDDNIHVLRPDRPPVDPRTEVPIEVQKQLDQELIGLIEKLLEDIRSDKINAVVIVGLHDEFVDHMSSTISSRVWGCCTQAVGMLEMQKAAITTAYIESRNAAIYEDDDEDEFED